MGQGEHQIEYDNHEADYANARAEKERPVFAQAPHEQGEPYLPDRGRCALGGNVYSH